MDKDSCTQGYEVIFKIHRDTVFDRGVSLTLMGDLKLLFFSGWLYAFQQ
jgi:hypothetical protein